jgi:hypothetical protein
MRTASLVASLVLSTTVCLVGCSSSGESSEGEIGSSGAAVGASTNEKIAYEFFVGKGLKSFQAAGIVGNLQQESGVTPTSVQYGGGPGRGIAQWSEGGRWNADSGDNVVWYASREGSSSSSLNLQLEFVWYELETFSGYGLAELRASTSVSAATVAFQDRYEGCGECDQSNRIAYAEAVLNAFGSTPAPPPPPPGPPTKSPTAPTGCGSIEEGFGLHRGEAFDSCDGRFSLVMQTDGNLVLYLAGSALWNSHTSGTDGFAANMQTDGNFVLYGAHSDALWQSHTPGHGGSHLDVQDDGNVVLYDGSKALWETGTSLPAVPAAPTACGSLQPGHGLSAGESLKSCDGRFLLAMQGDGNFVLYQAGKALWNAATSGKDGYFVAMQGDGNLVVYDRHASALWNSHTSGNAGASLALQDDGNLVVYSTASKALWNSGTAGK